MHRNRITECGWRVRAAVFALCIALLLMPPTAVGTERVRVVTDEYAPLVSRDPRDPGLLAEIVAQTFRHMEVESRLEFQPWRRGQAEVLAGRAWATFPYVKTPEREKTYLFSRKPLFDNRIVFFYRRNRFPDGLEWRRMSDLRQWTIGGVRGYWYEKDLKRSGLKAEYATTVDAAIRMLRIGRFDLLLLSELVGWHGIERMFPEEREAFAILERPYTTVPSWLMVSKTYPNSRDLLQRFDQAFRELEQAGRIGYIIDNRPHPR
jgi:polar amino acid transport system substrate-binding protein